MYLCVFTNVGFELRVAFAKHYNQPINPMKRFYAALFAIALLFATALTTKATTWFVNVQSFQFVNSPEIVTVGDTIVWTWVDGSHTTTSNTIPAGATPWDADITASFPTYSYVVEVPGTYGYHCIPHQGMMNETFVAQPGGTPLFVNITVSNTVSCTTGGCGATATADATGGTPPYLFEWSNGVVNSFVSDLCDGEYSLTVTDAVGATGIQTVTVTNTVGCTVPDSVSVTNTLANSFKVNWAGNDCAVKYRIRVRNMQTNDVTLYAVNAPQEFKTILSLSSNTMYQVRVRTQCSPSDLSAWSAPVYVTTAGGVVSPCVAPTNATAEGTPNNTANVSWSPVPNANGYRIRYREAGTTAWTPLVVPSGTDSTFVITDLAAGTTYEYQLRSKCTVNPTAWSAFTPIATFSTPLRLGESEMTFVNVYPNPSNGLVNINVSDNGTLVVFDAIGREVARRAVENKTTLTLTDLPEGLMLYHFVAANGLVERGSIVVIR